MVNHNRSQPIVLPALPFTKRKPTSQKESISTVAVINNLIAGPAIPKKVDKSWGHELHYRNDEKYCRAE